MKKKTNSGYKILRKLHIKEQQRSWATALVIILLVAAGGTYLLFRSHAAPVTPASEAEAGTLSGTATQQTDATVSGGKYVTFGSVVAGGGTSGGSGASCSSNCQPYGSIAAGPGGSWTPKLDDEFNSSALNSTDWIACRRNGDGSIPTSCGQSCRYNGAENDAYDASHVSVTGGNLALTMTNQAVSCGGGSYGWTGATVESKHNYTYGYFEARIKVPDLFHGWTAYWLTSAQTWPPELDIFEHTVNPGPQGQPSFTNHGNVDQTYYYSQTYPGTANDGSSLTYDTSSYHTYGMLWENNMVKIYYDGKLVEQDNGTAFGLDGNKHGSTAPAGDAIPSTPMYPIFDYAIGSGQSVTSGSQMLVDYFRVWQ